MHDDNFDFEMEEYNERRSLLDIIYSEPKNGRPGMILGSPWTMLLEYMYRGFVIVAVLFVLFTCVLASGC